MRYQFVDTADGNDGWFYVTDEADLWKKALGTMKNEVCIAHLPDRYPCLAKEVHMLFKPNGKPVQVLAYIYDVKLLDD